MTEYRYVVTASYADGVSEESAVASGIPCESAGAGYLFVRSWGEEGSEPGQFQGARGVCIDASGNIYVADTYNDRIQKFDGQGSYLLSWGQAGTNDGEFQSPYDVAADSSGNIYVVDNGNDRIQKFDSSGNHLLTWGGPGTNAGQFTDPCHIAAGSTGSIYVAETVAKTVHRFSNNGTFLARWGTEAFADGTFDSLGGIGVDNGGNVYVTSGWMGPFDTDITKFAANGSYITHWDGGYSSVYGRLAVDGSGKVFVIEQVYSRLKILDQSGTLLGSWGHMTRDPRDVAVGPNGEVVLIVIDDTSVRRIDRYVPADG